MSSQSTTYLYGLGRIAQVNTTTEYFLGDALGSVRQLTDASGEVTLANAYEPYGVLAQTAGSAHTSYGFTGEFTDPSGMVYLRARYYSPSDGRFLTRDTWMGEYNRPLSLNRWGYVEGNPVNYVDPTGQSPCDKLPLGERELCEMDAPDTTNYNQKIHPRGISWLTNPLANKITRDLAPIFDRVGKKIANTNAAQFKIGGLELACDPDFSTPNPYDCIPGSNRNQNYCGEVAISAILHTEYGNITAAQVATDFRTKMFLDRSSTTGYPPIADYIRSHLKNVTLSVSEGSLLPK